MSDRVPLMDAAGREVLGSQLGAAIDMLQNAIAACPEELWADGSRTPPFWALAFHTLFWLDLYLSGTDEGFSPPEPFGMEELDPAGRLAERPYARADVLAYLEHGRRKCRTAIDTLTDAEARRSCVFPWGEATFHELLLYNLRHVQHGAAQLNLILRHVTGSAPGWVARG